MIKNDNDIMIYEDKDGIKINVKFIRRCLVNTKSYSKYL